MDAQTFYFSVFEFRAYQDAVEFGLRMPARETELQLPLPHARYAELETVDNFDFQLR
jgi:hypothetical protein